MINVQRLDEIGSFRHQRLIEAIEGDLFCIRCNARLHQPVHQVHRRERLAGAGRHRHQHPSLPRPNRLFDRPASLSLVRA